MKKVVICIAMGMMAASMIGCANQQSTVRTKQGAVGGAVLGAAVGGVIGHQSGRGLEGAAIGGAVGAAGGAALGSAEDERATRQNW